MSFLNVCISPDSIATHLKCGGEFHTYFAANFTLFLSVKNCENQLTFNKVIAKLPPFYGGTWYIVIRTSSYEQCEYGYRYLTEEASPWVWLSLEDQTDWRSTEKNPSFWTKSKWLLKQFSDVAVTVLLSRLSDVDDSFSEEILSQVKTWSLLVEFEGMASCSIMCGVFKEGTKVKVIHA